jgi:hypothetical protein
MTAPDLLSERRSTAASLTRALAEEPATAPLAGADGQVACPDTGTVPVAAPAMQLRPAPALEPPYDDEMPDGPEGMDPLTAQLPFESDTEPVDPEIARLRRISAHAAAASAARQQLPDASAHAERVIRAIVEVINRQRSVQQLIPYLTPHIYSQVGQLQRYVRREAGAVKAPQAALRKVIVGQPTASSAEITAVIAMGRRIHAAAIRMEVISGRWQLNVFHML